MLFTEENAVAIFVEIYRRGTAAEDKSTLRGR